MRERLVPVGLVCVALSILRRASPVMGLALVLSSAATARDGGYEAPPPLSAVETLPNHLLKGPRHAVADEVVSDGLMNSYRIDSDFGQFEAYGTAVLQFRLREIGALAELDELRKTEVFADAVRRSAAVQVEAAREHADKPVETIQGVPGGVRRLMKRAGRSVEEVSTGEDAEELAEEGLEAGTKHAKKRFGVTGAERRWARKLGVDPYTDNEVLRREIQEVARVDAAGSFSVRLSPIPQIPGVNYLRDVTQLVWTEHPSELQALNEERLTSMGASQELTESLVENPAFNPSLQTLLVSGLLSLEGVDGREIAIAQAAAVDSREGALFFIQAINMLSGFHRSSAPVSRLLGGASLPGALTGDSRLVFLLPVDHVFWTEDIAAATRGPFTEVGADLELKSRELWLRGRVSERCRRELMEDGWRVLDEIRFSSASGVGP